MPVERSNVKYALWRKKVDKSVFDHSGTVVPLWVEDLWGLKDLEIPTLKKDPKALVKITFEKQEFTGSLTKSKQPKTRSNPVVRLWFSQELSDRLKRVFPMSYMRSLEQRLGEYKTSEVEDAIPFWEFLDVEFTNTSDGFKSILTAHYVQKSTFPNLFKKLIGSPKLKQINDEVFKSDEKDRIYKQDWKCKAELQYEIGAHNVIYYLVNSTKKQIYIGETEDLVARLTNHSTFKTWDLYRYDKLPDNLAPYRVELERMIIRDFAGVLKNSKDVNSLDISDYELMNSKIDQ